MATKPINTNPTADLPTNWTSGQTVAPAGTDVGLTTQHGYNYLGTKVNEALTDIGTINDAFTGLADKTVAFTVTLAAASWSLNAQTVSDVRFETTGYSYMVSPASASYPDYVSAEIYADDVTTSGQMTFHCTDVPSTGITVNVLKVMVA